MPRIASIKGQILFRDNAAQSQSWLRDGEVLMGFMAHSRAKLLNAETKGLARRSFSNLDRVPLRTAACAAGARDSASMDWTGVSHSIMEV